MPASTSYSRDEKIFRVLLRHPWGTFGLVCATVLAICLSAWGPATGFAQAIAVDPAPQEKMEKLAVASVPAAPLDPPSDQSVLQVASASQPVSIPAWQGTLQAASLSYLANSPDAALTIAHALGYAQGHGDPNNMCGPLAIAILRDAGLISKYVDPQAFWLWRPDKNPGLAETTFPADRFAHYQFSEALNQFDFKSFPLQPGDFLYLYAGNTLSYEHMLVVTRVDEAGRAYSVTNIKTNAGFNVQEVMLYDPNQPGAGQFYQWTDPQNIKVGLTGTGGFDLWRMTSAPPNPTPQEIALAEGIDQAIDQYGGKWHILIKQINGPVIYSRQADDQIPVASLIKVPIAMLFFKSLELSGIPGDQYNSYLSTQGDGRTYAQLLDAMLTHSEEDATHVLLQDTRSRKLDPDRTLKSWGITKMDVDTRETTASQLAALLEDLYTGGFITPEGRAMILNLMGSPVANDNTRLGILRSFLPGGSEFYEKRGTIVDEELVVGDSAIITLPDGDGVRGYVLVIVGSSQNASPGSGVLVTATEQIARAFWTFANSSP